MFLISSINMNKTWRKIKNLIILQVIVNYCGTSLNFIKKVQIRHHRKGFIPIIIRPVFDFCYDKSARKCCVKLQGMINSYIYHVLEFPDINYLRIYLLSIQHQRFLHSGLQH